MKFGINLIFLSKFFIVYLLLFCNYFLATWSLSWQLILKLFKLRLCSYLLLWTLASPPVETMPASRGGRGGGGIAVFLIAAIRVRRARRAAGVVIEVKIGGAAIGAASPTAATAPYVTLCLQQELPVYSFQVQVVHPEHDANIFGRQCTTDYQFRRCRKM